MSKLYVTLDTFIYSLPKNGSTTCTFTDNRGVIGYGSPKVASASEIRSVQGWCDWRCQYRLFVPNVDHLLLHVYLCSLIMKIK